MAQHIYKDYERVIAELKKYDNFIILRGYSNLDENYDDYESVYYEDCVGTAQSIDEALGKMFLSMISEMHEGIENNDDEETLYNDYIPVVPLYPINATCGLVIRFGMKDGVKKENVIKSSLLVLIISAVVTFMLLPLVGLYRAVAEWLQFFPSTLSADRP